MNKSDRDPDFQRFMAKAAGGQGMRKPEVRARIARKHCVLFLRAYADGEITFERFCRTVRDVMLTAPIGKDAQYYAIAHNVLVALGLEPSKRARGNLGHPQFIRAGSIWLVENVCKGMGTPISRTGRRFGSGIVSKTAFEDVAELWKGWGVKGVTPSAVEKWVCTKKYDEKRKTSD